MSADGSVLRRAAAVGSRTKGVVRRLAATGATPTERSLATVASALALGWAIDHFYTYWLYRRDWWVVPIFAVGVIALGACLRGFSWGPALSLVAAIAAGIGEREWRPPKAESDVLATIVEAFDLLRRGIDPYGAPITQSIPPGGTLHYPPGVFAIYGTAVVSGIEVIQVERASAMLLVVLLALTAWRMGFGRAAVITALYGTYQYATTRSLDFGTDTSLALLLGAGLILLWFAESLPKRTARWAFWGAVPFLALALLDKQLSWPIYLFVAVYLWFERPGGRRHVLATAGIAVATCIPFFLWGPREFLEGLVTEVTYHRSIYGINPLGMLTLMSPTAAEQLAPFSSVLQLGTLAVVVILFLRRRQRALAGAFAQGLAALFVALVLSRWTSPAYYMLLVPLTCLLIAIWPFEGTRVAGTGAARSQGCG